MQKKVFTFIFFLILTSCGYEAIYSKKNIKNYNFSISDLNFIGDKQFNLKIKEVLNNYTINKKNKDFILNISTTSEKVVLVKNTAGDATSFQNIVTMNVEVLVKNIFRNSFIISESFNYDNMPNKFDLQIYEREIKNNLAETASDKLIFRLSNIQ